MPCFHIIEDDGFVRETLEEMLEWTPYSCLAFFSGDEYLAYLDTPGYEPPVAILSDIKMPGTDGYALVQQLRQRHPDQRIVLISGHIDKARLADIEQQLCCVLEKPFHPEALEKIIDSLASCEAKAASGCAYEARCHSGINHSCPNGSQ